MAYIERYAKYHPKIIVINKEYIDKIYVEY
jgi:hypothetical protein